MKETLLELFIYLIPFLVIIVGCKLDDALEINNTSGNYETEMNTYHKLQANHN